MRFKVDENLPEETARLLRRAGYDASTVLDQEMEGKSYKDLSLVCQREQRALITLDLGFADIRTCPPKELRSVGTLTETAGQDTRHRHDRTVVIGAGNGATSEPAPDRGRRSRQDQSLDMDQRKTDIAIQIWEKPLHEVIRVVLDIVADKRSCER